MTDEKKDKTTSGDKMRRSSGDTARRIWLAGIGAYGRAFTEAQEAIKDMTGGTSRMFDELVQKGEVIESAVSSKGKAMMDKAQMPSLNVDERIRQMRSRLMQGESVARDIEDIEDRLQAIETKLDKLITLMEKPAARPAKKATTKRTQT